MLVALLTVMSALGGALPASGTDLVWVTLPPMPTPRAPGAAAAPCPAGQTGTCIYAIDGFFQTPAGQEQITDTVEAFDPPAPQHDDKNNKQK
jgi:hypothetical protein